MTWARTYGKKQDGRRNNGGARKGAGRPISNEARLILEKHLMSEVLVKERRHGQIRYVKKPILIAVLDELARQALQNNDIGAANTYLNITLGKPTRPSGKKPRYSRKPYLKGMVRARVFRNYKTKFTNRLS